MNQNPPDNAAAPRSVDPQQACSPSWERQDWTKTDRQISQERGISRQAANQMRRRLAAPHAPRPPKPLNKRETLAAARVVVEEIARWGKLGAADFLPKWSQAPWREFQDRVDALLARWPLDL